jgi:hypothetical protein
MPLVVAIAEMGEGLEKPLPMMRVGFEVLDLGPLPGKVRVFRAVGDELDIILELLRVCRCTIGKSSLFVEPEGEEQPVTLGPP